MSTKNNIKCQWKQSWFFEKSARLTNPLTKLTKRQRKEDSNQQGDQTLRKGVH